MRQPQTLLTTLLALHPSLSLANPHRHHEPRLGAVASESDHCSHIGTDILKQGGNAVDATVATVLCVGVIGMYHSGIGGGGFALVRQPDDACEDEAERYEFIDFRETAPAAAFEDMYKNNSDASIRGGLASGVPGELRGLEYMHGKYGSLPWSYLFQPAIKLARDGWTVNEDLVSYINSSLSASTTINNFFLEDPEWSVDFAPTGRIVQLGETITRKRYADTLEKIAENGPDFFYNGPLAGQIIDALTARNGIMVEDDLKNYTVAIRNTSAIEYRGYKLTSCGAPSGGPVALATLNILGGYDRIDVAGRNLTTHRLDEGMKFSYGMRGELGDPNFLEGINEYQAKMVSPETGRLVRSRISDTSVLNASAYDPRGLESLETPGTSHVAVADRSGLAVSLTTTINLLFGSQLVVPESGIIMNNEMNDFSIPNVTNAFGYIPSPANYVRPGKRPLSSMSPTIVENPDGSLYLVVGSAGGSRIITATIQNIWNVLDRNMTTPQALKEPRLHDQLVPRQVSLEYEYDNSTVAFLRERGHNITRVAPGGSTAQAIRLLSNGTWEAAGEPRQKNSGGFAV